MKAFKRILCLALVLVVSMMALSACGSVWSVDLTDPAKPEITSTTYFSEEELAMDMGELSGEEASGVTLLDSLKADNPDLELKDAAIDGVKYKYTEDYSYVKNPDNTSPSSYIDKKTGEETYVADTKIIYASKKKAELYNYGTYKNEYTTSTLESSEYLEFSDLKVKLPFKVYYTNGTKTGKKSVTFDKSFLDSKERCVAVASKAIYDEKKITVKGVKNGKTYKVGQEIKISSKNAIKVFTINDENIAANSYIFNEAGKYKIKIVLANGTQKKLTIKIK